MTLIFRLFIAKPQSRIHSIFLNERSIDNRAQHGRQVIIFVLPPGNPVFSFTLLEIRGVPMCTAALGGV